MKFLVPTDFSENARHAVEYASAIAQASDSAITLLHVITPNIASPGIRGVMADEIIAKMNEGIETLKRMVTELSADFPGVKFNYILHEGDTPESIIQKGIDEIPDMIIMGTLGASGIKKVLFGSNAVALIQHSTIPVLVVPAITKITVPKNFVFATDYNFPEMDSLLTLIKFADYLKSTINVVHIIKNIEEEKEELQIIEGFKAEVRKISSYSQLNFHIFRNSNILDGLAAFTKSTGADLLALTYRKRSAFEKIFDKSITEQLAYQHSIPILAFHES